MNKQQFEDIVKWQNETFPNANALSKALHLQDEVNELCADLRIENPLKRLEYADCFLLLFGSAAADGMTYEDIISCINEKFEINKKRTWGKPDENGIVKHVE